MTDVFVVPDRPLGDAWIVRDTRNGAAIRNKKGWIRGFPSRDTAQTYADELNRHEQLSAQLGARKGADGLREAMRHAAED